MSKASDWSQSRPRPFYPYDHKHVEISVDTDGNLFIPKISDFTGMVLSPEKAIELASWIFEVFGEPRREDDPL